MTRSKGSKNTVKLPTSYEIGCPAVNFYLAILARAKSDVFKCPEAREMVEGFAEYRGMTLEEYLVQEGGNVDRETLMDAAWWISRYIGEDEDGIS